MRIIILILVWSSFALVGCGQHLICSDRMQLAAEYALDVIEGEQE